MRKRYVPFVTGILAFDKATTAIIKGAGATGTQLSAVIRPYTCTVGPMNQVQKPGYFQYHDLNNFVTPISDGTNVPLPNEVREMVVELGGEHPVILHCFYHRSGQKAIIHGWLAFCEAKNRWKAWEPRARKSKDSKVIMDACIKIVTGTDRNPPKLHGNYGLIQQATGVNDLEEAKIIERIMRVDRPVLGNLHADAFKELALRAKEALDLEPTLRQHYSQDVLA